jgi:hypothetical protein
MEKRKKEKRKRKIAMRKEGFSRSEPSLLAVQGIAAVRCN